MRFRTFRILGLLLVIGVFISASAGIKYLLNQRPARPPATQTAPVAPAPEQVVPHTSAPEPLSTEGVRAKVEDWLDANPDRNGQMKLVNFLPRAPFRATAIRFPDAEAVKWTSNPRHWSQIRLDLNRDDTDDEKWLLKNGHTYKREVLDHSGRTISSEHFK